MSEGPEAADTGCRRAIDLICGAAIGLADMDQHIHAAHMESETA